MPTHAACAFSVMALCCNAVWKSSQATLQIDEPFALRDIQFNYPQVRIAVFTAHYPFREFLWFISIFS